MEDLPMQHKQNGKGRSVLYNFLDELGVDYQRVDHEAALR